MIQVKLNMGFTLQIKIFLICDCITKLFLLLI